MCGEFGGEQPHFKALNEAHQADGYDAAMRETVRMGRGDKVAPIAATLLQSDAESLTGISHQQVSRWRNSLKDEAKYRNALFGVACDRLERTLCHLLETSDPRIADLQAILDRIFEVEQVQTAHWHAAFWAYFQNRPRP